MPYPWWGYSGYWSPYYWGNWGMWYYPFPIHLTLSTGSLLMDMINLKAEKGEDKRLPVIWHNYITRLLYNSETINITLAERGIYQAFNQSKYITKNR